MSAQYIRCGTQCHAGDFDAGTLIQGRLPEDGQALLARFGGQVQMVYLDPPFNMVLQHRIAQKFQPLVVIAAHGRMGQRLPQQSRVVELVAKVVHE